MSGLRLSARERRTIGTAVGVAAAALVLVYAVLPFGRRWQAREAALAVEVDRLARLRGLIAAQPQLEAAAQARHIAVASGPRLLQGRSAALAASALQGLLQDIADESGVVVSRLDVAGAPEADPAAAPAIPATVSAIGDIWGVTDMLSLLQHAPHVLEIEELSVRPNPALRGELMQLTVRLRAGWLGS